MPAPPSSDVRLEHLSRGHTVRYKSASCRGIRRIPPPGITRASLLAQRGEKRGGNFVLNAAYFSPRTWFPLARPHIHFSPSKPYALGFQPQSLLDRRIAGQLDLAPSSKHALPWQSKSPPEHACHQSCRSRKSRRLRHPAIRRNLPARNHADRLLDPQSYRAGRGGLFLGFLPGGFQGIVVLRVGRCIPMRCPPPYRVVSGEEGESSLTWINPRSDPDWLPIRRAFSKSGNSRSKLELCDLPKRLQRVVFGIVHFKHRQQLRHLQQISHALGQIGQLDR